jgi:4-amino-4-deoxy-L-arabinose transferase-like glycosyltransferase
VGSVTGLLTSEMARDLFGRRTAILAGLIAATYPQLFLFDTWLYSESLATCLFAASCLATMQVVQRPIGWRWVLVGILIGITALVRPNGIYGLIAVVAWAAAVVWRRPVLAKRAVLAAGLIVLGCIAILAPGTVRNFVVTAGAFVPLSSGGGIVLAGAYSNAAYETSGFRGNWVNPANNPYMDAEDRSVADSFSKNGFSCWGRCEVVRDQAFTQMGLRWLRTHLNLIPRLLTLREGMFWQPASPLDEAGMKILRPVAIGYPTLVIALALPGLLALLRRRQGTSALIFIIYGATVIAGGLVFYGSPRMRSSLEPFLVT